jgi:hypothetical protein
VSSFDGGLLRKLLGWAAACSVLLVPLALTGQRAHAEVVVAQDPGALSTTTGLTGFMTFGSNMVGMSVTAFFDDGTSEAVSWMGTTPVAGGAFGTGWSLTESGDTFSSPWTLTNTRGTALRRLLLDGAPGMTAFDRSFGGAFGTPDSFLGLDYSVTAGLLPTDMIVATYRDLIAVTPAPAVGDIFRMLDVLWSSPAGFASGRTLNFLADTDNATTEIVGAVPEPTGFALFALGVVSLIGYGWRRFK